MEPCSSAFETAQGSKSSYNRNYVAPKAHTDQEVNVKLSLFCCIVFQIVNIYMQWHVYYTLYQYTARVQLQGCAHAIAKISL